MIKPKPISPLVANSAIIFGGNAVANITNYLYNIIMARFLGPELFAALAALLATMTIIGIPAQALLLGFATFAANLAHDRGKLRYLWVSGLGMVGILGSLLALVAIAFTTPLTHFLHLNYPLAYILLMLSIPIGLLVAVNRGVIQGLERFWAYAGSIGAEGLTKVALGLALVLGGYRLGGATAAVLGASVMALLATVPVLWPLTTVQSVPFLRRSLLGFSLFTLFVTFVITIFLNADVIAAKAFLPADVAGHYAAASTIAKIIPYVVSAVVSAMLPRVAQLVTRKERPTPVLIEAFVITLTGSLGMYALYLLAPRFILGVLYGTLYLDAAPLLARLGAAFLVYAVANVFLTYFLSTKDVRISWALVVSSLGLLGLLARFHASATELSGAMLGASLLLLLTVGGTYAWSKRTRLLALAPRD